MENIRIDSSLSDGLSIIAQNERDKTGILSNTLFKNIEISTYGIGVKDRHGLWIARDAHGSLTLVKPTISEKIKTLNILLLKTGGIDGKDKNNQ